MTQPPEAPDAAAAPATAWGPRALVLVALSSPLWPTSWGAPQLTVGRVLLVVLAAAVVVDLAPVRARVPRPAGAAVRLLAGLGLLLAWMTLSAATRGSFAAGSVQGFAELVLLTGLVAIVGLYASPRLALAAVGAATLGVLAGGLLAAAGLRDLHAAVYAPSESVARLEGVYGNPNFLGCALALALPAAAAGAVRLPGWRRWVAAAATLTLAGLLLATFSRGSLVAAAIGVPVAAALAIGRRPRPRVALAGAVAVLVLAGGVFVSPFYRSQRLEADFGAAKIAAAGKIDRSGWYTGPVGPVRVTGSTLTNPAGSDALRVRTTRAGQGVTIDLGQAFGDASAAWRFTVRQEGGAGPLDVHWQVMTYPGGRVVAGVTPATAQPRPTNAAFAAHLSDRYLISAWTEHPGTFVLDDVALYERRPGRIGGARPLPTRLLGPGTGALHQAEENYARSRWTALRLAVDAFAEHPLLGLGHSRFPGYAQQHSTYGPLPTHNTYTQVLAELGLLGVLALAAVLATLAVAVRRGRPRRPLRAALAGTLAAGTVNLLFINALASPGMLMPLCVTMGLTVAWAGPVRVVPQVRLPRRRGPRRTATAPTVGG
jgi:O-antigen ligase